MAHITFHLQHYVVDNDFIQWFQISNRINHELYRVQIIELVSTAF